MAKYVFIDIIPHPLMNIMHNYLYEMLEHDYKVFYSGPGDLHRRWENMPKINYEYEILPGYPLRLKKREDTITFWLNYSVGKALKNSGCKLVMISGWETLACFSAGWFCHRSGTPYMVFSSSTELEKSWRRTLTKPLVRRFVKNAVSYVVCGKQAKDYLVSLGAMPERIFSIVNGVDNEFFLKNSRLSGEDKKTLKNSLGLPSGPTVLFVGQLIKRKGILILLEAFRLLRESGVTVSLLIVGTGQLEKEIKEFADKYSDKSIYLTGHIEMKDLPKYYGVADIFILPSLEEVWGYVVNEAMASGLPVIVSDVVGAADELVDDGKTGIIVPAGSANAVADEIRKLIYDEKLRISMGSQSLKKIQSHTIKSQTQDYADAIKKTEKREWQI